MFDNDGFKFWWSLQYFLDYVHGCKGSWRLMAHAQGMERSAAKQTIPRHRSERLPQAQSSPKKNREHSFSSPMQLLTVVAEPLLEAGSVFCLARELARGVRHSDVTTT